MYSIDDEIRALRNRLRQLEKQKQKMLREPKSTGRSKKYKKVPYDDFRLEEAKKNKFRYARPKTKGGKSKLRTALNKEIAKAEHYNYKLSFENYLKNLKMLTKYRKLRAEYNKAVRLATALGINKGYQIINIKSLEREGFIPTKESILQLEEYMQDVIQKFEGTVYDPNFLMGMLNRCVTKSIEAGFYSLSNRILYIATNEETYNALQTRIPQYSQMFYDYIEELYRVCSSDEDRSNELLDLIEELITEVLSEGK